MKVADLPFVAPGFIDLQVNGFAGVDYNDPTRRTRRSRVPSATLFATGVTRFYPTVITGGPDEIAGSLRNLNAAKETLA